MKIKMTELYVDITDDSIRIYDQFNNEIVGWIDDEWIENPKVTMSIAIAINLAHTNPDELLNLIQFGKIR